MFFAKLFAHASSIKIAYQPKCAYAEGQRCKDQQQRQPYQKSTIEYPPPHRHSGHQNSNPSKRLNTTSLRVRKSHGSKISSKTSAGRFASGSASKRSR